MNRKYKTYVGVGSNVGQRADNCRQAFAAISACNGCLLEAQASLYETEPVESEDQDWFVNSVVRLRTCLEPDTLLLQLQAIEHAMGRRSGGPRYGPRTIDLDILLFDDRILHTTSLQLPHPRLHERRFVLKPLCEIAPKFVHPVLGQTMQYLLSNLKDGEKKVVLYE